MDSRVGVSRSGRPIKPRPVFAASVVLRDRSTRVYAVARPFCALSCSACFPTATADVLPSWPVALGQIAAPIAREIPKDNTNLGFVRNRRDCLGVPTRHCTWCNFKPTLNTRPAYGGFDEKLLVRESSTIEKQTSEITVFFSFFFFFFNKS